MFHCTIVNIFQLSNIGSYGDLHMTCRQKYVIKQASSSITSNKSRTHQQCISFCSQNKDAAGNLFWMLLHGGLSSTVCEPHLTPVTPLHPETSQLSPRCMEHLPESAAMHKPTPENKAVQAIALEPKLCKMSDKMFEPAKLSTMGVLVEFEGME